MPNLLDRLMGQLQPPRQPQKPATPAKPASQSTTPVAAPKPAGIFKDAALDNAFTQGPTSGLGAGATGKPVVAVQYALARLGYPVGKVDGDFGPGTERALKAFQRKQGLPETGAVDEATLKALDGALAAQDLRPPAAQAADPMAYLRDFAARGLTSPIVVEDKTKPIDWRHPEIQKAYGEFVGQFWRVSKENKVEADCKNLALHFMDAFRAKVKQDLGVALPMPKNGDKQLPEEGWTVTTAERNTFTQADGKKVVRQFSRASDLETVRPGYDLEEGVEALDPKASLLQGVNVSYGTVGAKDVAAAATPRLLGTDNGGDESVAEVPLQKLQPGDVIFIDHTGDGAFDHVLNVVGVKRREDGTVSKIILATGSFDDMKDADGSTRPRGYFEVNNYTEEITVDVGQDGRISDSRVTWSSEPSWVVSPRYSHRSTLMELRPGGKIMVGRWG